MSHVLSFGPHRQHGAAHPVGWRVGNLDANEVHNALATLHEAHHAGLNASTAWGALLQAVAGASRLVPGEPAYKPLLGELARRCRRTHEAYATHASITGILNADPDSSVDTLLEGYPEYRAHLRDAVEIGPAGPLTQVWRQAATEAALEVCLQPRILPLPVPLARFRASQLRVSDGPDHRYTLLRGLATQLWAEVDEMCRDEMGSTWREVKQLDARTRDGTADLLERVEPELRRMCVQAATLLLNSRGRPTMTTTEMQEAVPGVVEALSEALGDLRNPMRSGLDTDDGIAHLYDLERIDHHPPLAARVRPAASVAPARHVSGKAPDRHVYIVARRAAVLARQFDLDDCPWRPEQTVCAVQVPRVDPDGGRSIDLYPLSTPDELDRVTGLGTDRGVLVSAAASACRDAAWRTAWLPRLARSGRLTLLGDLPVLPSIDALARADPEFRYTLAEMPIAGRVYYLFGASMTGEPPLLTPCSFLAGLAFAGYAARRSSAGTGAATLDALGADPGHIPLIAAHLVLDEAFTETAQ